MEKIKIVNREFYSLELLRLDLEYFQLKGDFFEQQSHLWSKLITNQERELDESLKELQELIVKLNDRNDEKEQLASHLKHVKLKKSKEAALTSPQKVLVRKNGFFNCPECSYKTIYKQDLNQHINAVHRKLKPWKCSECDKAFFEKAKLTNHQKSIHASKKDWVCDCCGSRYGIKQNLKRHMKTHLPPSFACSKCPRKFVQHVHFKSHLKIHQGILSEFCKHCNKGFLAKNSLSSHIVYEHFAKMHCEIPNCSYKTGSKGRYKLHLKETHKYSDKNLVEKLLGDLEKLKPDFQELKYI